MCPAQLACLSRRRHKSFETTYFAPLFSDQAAPVIQKIGPIHKFARPRDEVEIRQRTDFHQWEDLHGPE